MYFQTSEHLGTPIARGRDVTAGDTLDTFQCRSINDNNNGGGHFTDKGEHTAALYCNKMYNNV